VGWIHPYGYLRLSYSGSSHVKSGPCGPMHDCAYFAWAQSGSTVEHSAVGIHAIPRPAANHISQIHLTAENFMGLTTVEYFVLLISC
jgi:hypothetical protein